MLVQFLLHVLGYDIWFYYTHRLLHTRTFWWIHAKHHERQYNLRWPDTYYGHWIEVGVQGMGYLLPALFRLWDWPSAILGALFIHIRGMARHDERFTWLMGDHHLKHHATKNGNYGEPWMDILCGTRKFPPADLREHRTCSAAASDRKS